MKDKIFTLVILVLMFTSGLSQAQETSLMIRVKSKDAKFIGSSVGGAKVIVRDDLTGKILAEGLTLGSTGDTKLIMGNTRERGQNLSDDLTAGFKAVLNIDQPTFVTVEAFAPINKRQALVRSSTQLWVIPGMNILGDGIVLEVPGFIIDILSPQTHERIGAEAKITISANVVMMCGCPVTPGGTWNANNYTIRAVISKAGKHVSTEGMKSTDKENTFSTSISLAKGDYEIAVYAFDPGTGNTGLDKVNVLVD